MLEHRGLELLIRDSVPIIIVETLEEQRGFEALAKAAVGGFYKLLNHWDRSYSGKAGSVKYFLSTSRTNTPVNSSSRSICKNKS